MLRLRTSYSPPLPSGPTSNYPSAKKLHIYLSNSPPRYPPPTLSTTPLSVSLYGGYNSLNEAHAYLALLLPTAPRWAAFLLPRSIHETVGTPAEPSDPNLGHAAGGGVAGPGTDAVFSSAPLRTVQIFHDPTHISIDWSRLTFLRLCPAVCRNLKVARVLKAMELGGGGAMLEELIIGCNLVQEDEGDFARLLGGPTDKGKDTKFTITSPVSENFVSNTINQKLAKSAKSKSKQALEHNNSSSNHTNHSNNNNNNGSHSQRAQLNNRRIDEDQSLHSHLRSHSDSNSTLPTSSSAMIRTIHPNTHTSSFSPFLPFAFGERENGGAPQLLSLLILPALEVFEDRRRAEAGNMLVMFRMGCLRDVFVRGAAEEAQKEMEMEMETVGENQDGGHGGVKLYYAAIITLTTLITPASITEEEFISLLKAAPRLERLELRGGVKGLGNAGVGEMVGDVGVVIVIAMVMAIARVPMVLKSTGLGKEKEKEKEKKRQKTQTQTQTQHNHRKEKKGETRNPQNDPSPKTPHPSPPWDLCFDASVFVDMVESRWGAALAFITITPTPIPTSTRPQRRRCPSQRR
ncbi:hypothetical protein D9758_017307 [Tetrapyrgos nigripes]|uniref:Uncharacterized protein n=1 Tax=Tetrapyrgos nigripes TaxID=182062 RepID=A0A8H5BH68_9AGAR|nr:hypothetical protein D9758_017307 [Tetrapyrgos nigripes]